MSLYKLENITRSYNKHAVLEAVSLTLEPGKTYALVGENGTGKTTLLDTLALLEPPQAGRLFFNDQPIDFSADLTALRRQISFCLQQPIMFRASVLNNIAFGLKARQVVDPVTTVKPLAARLGLTGLLDKSAIALSGGETQKVALARTFILETAVMIFDEPTANLDEASIAVLNQLMNEAKDRGQTVIFASHRLNNAFRLADEVITLEDKKVFPHSYQNFFTGEVIPENGLQILKINDRVSFILASERHGQVKVSIDPKEIIVSKQPFDSSARNCLTGRVSSIIDEDKTVQLTADCGIKLVAQITHKSLDELGLNVGHTVYLTFKTSSIKVY